MNFLQIWIGEIPLNRIKYMESVINFVKENDNYFLVSDYNFLCDNLKINWIDINNIKGEIFKIYPFIEKIWGNLDRRYNADIIRFYLASIMDNIFYLDTDVELLKYPIFEDKCFPYFSLFKKCKIDNYCFYSNNNKEFFKNFLNDIMQENIQDLQFLDIFNCIQFNNCLQNFRLKNKVNIIEDFLLIHHNLNI